MEGFKGHRPTAAERFRRLKTMEVSDPGATSNSGKYYRYPVVMNACSKRCCCTCCAEYWLLWIFLAIFYGVIILVMISSSLAGPSVGKLVSKFMEFNFVIGVVIVTIAKNCCNCCKGTPKLEPSKQEQPKQEQRRKSGSSRKFWLVTTDYRVVAAVETS